MVQQKNGLEVVVYLLSVEKIVIKSVVAKASYSEISINNEVTKAVIILIKAGHWFDEVN